VNFIGINFSADLSASSNQKEKSTMKTIIILSSDEDKGFFVKEIYKKLVGPKWNAENAL